MSEPWERDPFLLIHRLANGEYSIAGKYNPASIKDQMVRAVTLVDRAHFHKLIENPKRLLVVGAGAAGASAAFRACEHKINTTLMEVKAVPFDRQRNSSRVVDPTEFDWPAPHWERGSMPGLPLTFDRFPANALAARWQETYDRQVRDNDYLTIQESTRFVRSLPLPGGRHAVLFKCEEEKGPPLKMWEEFDFVLNCTGPGEENVSIPGSKHAAYRFWADDQLEATNFGLPRPLPQPRILISGDGDGALQDFLRIAFPGKTPRDIYQQLIPAPELRAEIELRLFAAEDGFRRAWVWSEDPSQDCQVLTQLHEAHLTVAKAAAANTGAKLPDPGRLANVRVFHSCMHFSVCYAFNHFLALLVNELAGGKHFEKRRRLRTVDSADDNHICDLEPAYCWEHAHEAHFWESECGKPPKHLDKGTEFDIVVVRHGPKADTPKLARQILPYSSVWK